MKTVVMCGGGGTRLWPLSRLNMPKQFAKLTSDKSQPSLFQQTLLRNSKITEEYLVVVNKNQLHLAQAQAQELSLKQSIRFLSEPFGKNTAAVIALSCQMFHDQDHILVVPSDHFVANEESYRQTVLKASPYLESNRITLFGISPKTPETGFGYIEFKGDKILSFKEKPDSQTAEKYLSSGNYLWNSGIFGFKNLTMKSEFQRCLPQTYEVSLELKALVDQSVVSVPETLMQKFESLSIDYGVIEKSENLSILNATDWTWSDLGSFEALAAISKEATSKNIHQLDSKNNFVISDREVVLIGQNNLVVVDTGDALLISAKGSSAKVKDILPNLSQPELTKNHLTEQRPWGSYTVLEDGANYKVKSIIVNPDKRLSLQKHKFRAEVWTVVRGVATVTIDDKTYDMKVNETCFIPQGSVHRLTNKTSEVVEIIEIQTGESFDESDIIRLEDDFNRL